MKKNSITQVLLTLANLNPKQRFARDMKKLMADYGDRASRNSLKAIIKYLGSKEREIIPGDFDKIEMIIEEEYNRYIPEIGETLLARRKELYKHYKRKLPAAKMIWINQLDKSQGKFSEYTEEMIKYIEINLTKFKKSEDDIFYNLNMEDQRAIEYLTMADIVYLKDHAKHQYIGKQIAQDMVIAQENKVLGNQLIKDLQANYSEMVPTEYAKKFGEIDYWRGVVRYYDTITKTATTLNDFNTAGYDTYRWYARMTERTCLTCGELHNKVFKLQPALDALEQYYQYAENNDIDGLKKANPWLKNKDEAANLTDEDGFFPPAHFRCECFIRMDLGRNYL